MTVAAVVLVVAAELLLLLQLPQLPTCFGGDLFPRKKSANSDP